MASNRSPSISPPRSRSPKRRKSSSHKSSRRDSDRVDSRERYERSKEKTRNSERSSGRSRGRSREREREKTSKHSRSRSPRRDRHHSKEGEREHRSSRNRHLRRSPEPSKDSSPRRDKKPLAKSEPHQSKQVSKDQLLEEANSSSKTQHEPIKSLLSTEGSNKESSLNAPPQEQGGLSSTTRSLLDSQEERIKQRRERVEKWRKEKEEARLREIEAGAAASPQEASTKVWSLEDDEEDEENAEEANKAKVASKHDISKDNNVEPTQQDTPTPHEEEGDEDPLDAYMQDIEAEAKKLNKLDYEKLEANKRPVNRLNFDAEEEESEDSEPEDILALAAKKIKKKDVPVVDHTRANYEPFRKDFYIEPLETQNMTESQVEDFRTSLDGIKIRGVNCPKPVKRWTHCGFPAGCLEVIRRQNFTAPTPIQAQAIPAIMSGRDVIGVAKTGSGKTLAFLLPMFRHIRDQRPLENGEGPISIIMTPTRELATQIHRECKPFLKTLGIRAVCIYGGTGMQSQINDIKRGAEIVVCTPGRMIDFLCANSGRLLSLSRVTMLVLDEADRMFDLGFEPQVMKIVNNVRPDRQTVLFSATFPRQMEALARKILKKPLEITVGGRSVVCADVHQIVEVREEKTKFTRLLEILGNFYQSEADEEKRTLIFVDRQEAADNLLRDLMHKGYPCMSLHGGKDQVDRDATISDFRSGVCQILVATSIAARGLDVKNLALVINYECPNHMEDYVHRVGRTGRAGNKGTAYTFVTPAQDRYANDILKALTASNALVSQELQDLAEQFQLKVNAGSAHQAGSGFGGKGLETLDKQRDLVKLVQKKTYGNNEDEDSSSDEELPSAQPLSQNSLADPLPNKTTNPSQAAAAIRAAQLAAAKINAAVGPTRARDAIAEINAKFRVDPLLLGEMHDHLAPAQSTFSQEIEINGYPQKARWRVTNKEQINQITEHSGAAVTTRGEYIPPNESIPPGSARRKLHLFIEADNQIAVDIAVREIKSLLKEATLLAFEAESRNGTSGGGHSGRYSVL